MAALCACLVVGACLVGRARAQVPRELVGRPVTLVEVAGPVRRVTRVRELGIPLGAPLSRALLRRTTQRLLASGRWEDVQLDVAANGEGVVIRAMLVPRVELLRVDVVGNDEFDDAEIRRAIGADAGTVLRPDSLDEWRGRLRGAYRDRGFDGAEIDLILRDTDDPSRRLLVVRVDEREPTEIESIVFDPPLPARTGVHRAMSIGTGDRLDRDAALVGAREAEQRLRTLGYFEASVTLARVEERGSDAVLHYDVHLGPRFQVRIDGQGPLGRDDVLEVMRLQEERMTDGVITAMEQRVIDLARRHGYADAQVEVLPVKARRPAPGFEAVLLVRITTGNSLVVEQRSYPGARHFDDEFLDDQVDVFLEEASGGESPFDPVDDGDVDALLADSSTVHGPRPFDLESATVWYEPAYEAAAEHIQELYRAEGFLEARVGPARLEREGARARVRIPVFEGPQASLYGVRLEGNEALDAATILRAAGLERGDSFSYLELERAKDRVVSAYQERGYYYAGAEVDVRFSEDRTRAEVTLRVRERFEVRVRGVRIVGADRTSEALVRRVAGIDDGDLLTPQLMRGAQDRLLELGVFSSVSAAPIEPDLPARTKRVLLTLSERRTQFLDFRFGVSTAQGARGSIEYGIRNIRGLALEASLRAQLGYQFFFLDDTLRQRFEALSLGEQLERRVVLTFAAPYIGIPNVRASLSLSNRREIERNFALDANAIDLTFGWRPLRGVSIQFSGGVENNAVAVLGSESYEDVLRNTTDPRLRSLLRVPEGETTLVASNIGVTWDRRDSPFTTTRGFLTTGSLEWAKTVSDSLVVRDGEERRFSSHHLKLVLGGSAYIPLGRDFVFATELRFGRVFHLTSESETYPNRKFFLGGVDTVRGYLQDALVPQDLADEICDPNDASCALPDDFNVNAVVQGGDVFLTLRGELRFPIYGSLRGGAFVDLGNSWVNAGELNPFRLRPTAGFGIRISTPVGPIAFDYGILILRRRFLNEPFGSFHFSIGLF